MKCRGCGGIPKLSGRPGKRVCGPCHLKRTTYADLVAAITRAKRLETRTRLYIELADLDSFFYAKQAEGYELPLCATRRKGTL